MTMMANITIAQTVLPNVAPIIMNMALSGWLELVGDIGSGIFCDPPAGPGGGEGTEDGTENVGEFEGVGEEDIGSGVEDEGESENR